MRKIPFINLLLILALSAFFFTPMQAQNPANLALLESTTPEERAAVQTELLGEKLALDTAQLTQLRTINLKYAEKMEPVIKGNSSNWNKYRTATRFDKEKDVELKGLLSAAQFEAYQAYKAKLREDSKTRLLEQRRNVGN
ncbi:MAG: hypothetical protein R2828_07995 [Saprospiraceae bacterium]